jgi:hypothetical protein
MRMRWSRRPLLKLLELFGLKVNYNALGIDYAQFNLTYADGQQEGRVQWNAEDGTLEYGLPGGTVNLQIGQEHVVRCRNESGDPIADGKVVYVAGEVGNRPSIGLADADTTNPQPEAVVLGMTTEVIGNNSTGYVTLMGLVRDINTDGISPGSMVWLSADTPGEFQDSPPPAAPNRHIAVGQVITEGASNGSVYVRVMVIPPVMLLSDVLLGTPNDGDILVWVDANKRFELKQP